MTAYRQILIRIISVGLCLTLLGYGGLVSGQSSATNPIDVVILLLDEFARPQPGQSENAELRLLIYDQVQSLVEVQFAERISSEADTEEEVQEIQAELRATIDELFGLVDILVIDSEYPVEVSDLCIADLPEFGVDGLGLYYVGGTGPGSPNLHGEMVSSAIMGAATDPLYAGMLAVGTSTLGANYTVEATDNVLGMTHVIEVVHADTNSFDLDAVNQQISDYLDGVANPNLSEETHKWVVNASFAIVPCADLATLAAYNDALLALETLLPDSARKVVLLQQAILRTAEKIRMSVAAGWQACGMVLEGGVLIQTGDTQYDSCRVFVENMQRVGVFVAAAGNTGLDYPYYPAAEPAAVSVSASFENAPFIGTITDRDCINRVIGDEPCSNAGEVLMPGVIEFNSEPYFGTSFAAPRLSLRLAVYLARYGDNVCELLNDIDPATGQPVFSDIPLVDLPALDIVLGDGTTIQCDPLQEVRDEVFMD